MGGMLSQPVTSSMLQRSGNAHYRVGRADIQGHRLDMEDEMTARLGFPGAGREDYAFFGVFDGHAGACTTCEGAGLARAWVHGWVVRVQVGCGRGCTGARVECR